MSDTPQTIKIYNLRSDTNEFIGAGDAYIPPHTGYRQTVLISSLLEFRPAILRYLTLKPKRGV